MNPPESAAQGSEARNLNTVQRHGTGAVPQGTEAQAMQPSAAPTFNCLLGSKAGEAYPSCKDYPNCICGGDGHTSSEQQP